MARIRLDKLLAQSGERTRSDAARLLRQGLVRVNGAPQRDPGFKADPERDEITLSGEPVGEERFQYVLLHKPAGLLTAARDARAATVMSLVPEALQRRSVLPVGRLDKDTTGLLLLTNDGELAHRLLSPKRHVRKEYHALVEGRLCQLDVETFARGVPLKDFTALPAEMEIVEAGDDQSKAVVWLAEGKFHQVKRMFGAVHHPVVALHRVAFGPLRLPAGLGPGEYRALTPSEIQALRQAAGMEAGQ